MQLNKLPIRSTLILSKEKILIFYSLKSLYSIQYLNTEVFVSRELI